MAKGLGGLLQPQHQLARVQHMPFQRLVQRRDIVAEPRLGRLVAQDELPCRIGQETGAGSAAISRKAARSASSGTVVP
jgi:hypothetical protein